MTCGQHSSLLLPLAGLWERRRHFELPPALGPGLQSHLRPKVTLVKSPPFVGLSFPTFEWHLD